MVYNFMGSFLKNKIKNIFTFQNTFTQNEILRYWIWKQANTKNC